MSVATISVINADVGSYVGDWGIHPNLLAEPERGVGDASAPELAINGNVNSCGDDVNPVMSHRHGVDLGPEHHFAWDTFVEPRCARSPTTCGRWDRSGPGGCRSRTWSTRPCRGLPSG
jgi:fructose 1,6-bisphosphatase